MVCRIRAALGTQAAPRRSITTIYEGDPQLCRPCDPSTSSPCALLARVGRADWQPDAYGCSCWVWAHAISDAAPGGAAAPRGRVRAWKTVRLTGRGLSTLTTLTVQGVPVSDPGRRRDTSNRHDSGLGSAALGRDLSRSWNGGARSRHASRRSPKRRSATPRATAPRRAPRPDGRAPRAHQGQHVGGRRKAHQGQALRAAGSSGASSTSAPRLIAPAMIGPRATAKRLMRGTERAERGEHEPEAQQLARHVVTAAAP